MSKLDLTLFGTATLGGVIEALKRFDPDTQVHFDFGYLRPTAPRSYRGDYDHLALGWSEEKFSAAESWPPVRTVLEWLEGAIGKDFEGYKGGGGTADRDTPLWAAKWGEAPSTAIVGIDDDIGGFVVIHTAYVG